MKPERFSAGTVQPIRVDVVEAGAHARQGTVRCVIGDNIKFSTEGLETYFFAGWNPLVVDLLLVAAAVEFCDRLRMRPQLGWARSFEVRLPVHDVAHWRTSKVHDSLAGTLGFLTGDQWNIEFVQRKTAALPVRHNLLHLPSGIRVLIPYSGGLDSRAVAGLISAEKGRELVRVRLGALKPEEKRQRQARQPFTAVPYRVSLGPAHTQESTARSRGFKFAAVTAAAARLADASEIIVPESGQGALGPALVVSGQGYADYRNNPTFTARMEKFLEALFGSHIAYQFPRIWNTKGETLSAFARLGHVSDRWSDSRSCWQQSRQASVNNKLRQCGICAACMLRRLSVHAAGLDEPQTAYVWENLSAPSMEEGAASNFKGMTGAMREYCIAGVLHLDHLAVMAGAKMHDATITRVSREVSEALGQDKGEAKSKLEGILTRHRAEWCAFLEWLGPSSFVTKLALAT